MPKFIDYSNLIEDKFERGDIDYERYCFLIDKLTQWYHVYSEMEAE